MTPEHVNSTDDLMTPTPKIFLDKEPSTGDFLMRIPAEAMPDLYKMLLSAPLTPRRWFFQVKEHIDEKYPEYAKCK